MSKRTYAEKKVGNMMYGPGCCGNKIPDEKLAKRKHDVAVARKLYAEKFGDNGKYGHLGHPSNIAV